MLDKTFMAASPSPILSRFGSEDGSVHDGDDAYLHAQGAKPASSARPVQPISPPRTQFQGSPPVTRPPKRKFGTVQTARPTPTKRRITGFVDGHYTTSDPQTLGEKLAKAANQFIGIYDYNDCPLPPDHIRLLFLKPSRDPEADIVVELQTFPIDELAANPESFQYTALSYNWGDGEASKTILVDMTATVNQPSRPLLDLSSVADHLRRQVKGRVKTLAVKPNLHAFLREFRRANEEVTLWVDRVCINQESNEEKQDQVSRMHLIYSIATNVSIWLGPPDADRKTDRAMDFISGILEGDDIRTKLTGAYARDWSELLYLMRRRWFSRRWIIQELALAKSAEVRCGSKTKNWRDFADAVSIFVLHSEAIFSIIRNQPELEKSLEGIRDLNPLGARILVEVLSNTFQRRADGTIYAPRKGLESLISSLSTFSTSDPRDTVYTLLNLAKETFKATNLIAGGLDPEQHRQSQQLSNPPPVPDYTIDLLDVYTNFVKWCIQENNSLDIICRHWALPEIKKELDAFYPRLVVLPSWIKTVRGSAYGSLREGFGGRRTGDSFVGTPEDRHYNASLGRRPVVSFGRDEPVSSTPRGPAPAESAVGKPDTHHPNRSAPLAKRPYAKTQDPRHLLEAQGLCIGRVTKTFQMLEGIIPKQVLECLGHDSNKKVLDGVSDAVWRTLVADRSAEGKMPPAWYHRACMTCLVAGTGFGHIDTNGILNRDNTAILVADYLKRVQAVCWNRTFIKCEGSDGVPNDDGDDPTKSLVGIGPDGSEEGDFVCILFGCSVPVILRGVWDKTDLENPIHYTLEGEAFILGQMDGQALTDLSEEELEKRSEYFKLR